MYMNIVCANIFGNWLAQYSINTDLFYLKKIYDCIAWLRTSRISSPTKTMVRIIWNPSIDCESFDTEIMQLNWISRPVVRFVICKHSASCINANSFA